MSPEDFKRCAESVLATLNGKLPEQNSSLVTTATTMIFKGRLVPKGRPRGTKSGRHYTPASTRQFESEVRKAALQQVGEKQLGPVQVNLVLLTKGTKEQRAMSSLGYAYPHTVDVDNVAKSVLDACNGVLWKDDKQISKLNIAHYYGSFTGFSMIVYKAGLLPSEVKTLERYIKDASDA